MTRTIIKLGELMDSIIILMIGIGISVILTAKENAKKRQELVGKKQVVSRKPKYEQIPNQQKRKSEIPETQIDFAESDASAVDFHIETIEHDTDVYYEPTQVNYEEDKELANLKKANYEKKKQTNKKKVSKPVAKMPVEKSKHYKKEKKVSLATSSNINLKRAYIWKEILDKPMALREEELW